MLASIHDHELSLCNRKAFLDRERRLVKIHQENANFYIVEVMKLSRKIAKAKRLGLAHFDDEKPLPRKPRRKHGGEK